MVAGGNSSSGADKQALFAVCCPYGAIPPAVDLRVDGDVVFKTAHRLDLTLLSIDHR